VRSTPARQLHKDQLLVERHAVHKINKVEYPLPQNTVTVELTNQLTGEQCTRNLRWDEQVTIEQPFEVKIGETGKIKSSSLYRLMKNAGRSIATRSPTKLLELIMRERISTWVQGCARTTQGPPRRF